MNYLDIFPHDLFSATKSRLSPGPAHNFRLAYETDECAPSMYSCEWLVVMLAFESFDDPDKEKYPERVQMRIALSIGLTEVLDFIYRRHVFDEHNFMSIMTSYMDIAIYHCQSSSIEWILDLFAYECENFLVNEMIPSVCFAACKHGFIRALKILVDKGLRLASETMDWALNFDNFYILQFGRENGLEWDEYSVELAIRTDNLAILRYVLIDGAPYDHGRAIAAARLLPEESFVRIAIM